MRVTVDFRHKSCHDFQLGVVSTDLDVKVFHVVWGASPPVFRMICHVVRAADDRWLPVLRAGRSVQVEAVQPDPSTIQHFPSVIFVEGLSSVWKVQIQVSGSPTKVFYVRSVDHVELAGSHT